MPGCRTREAIRDQTGKGSAMHKAWLLLPGAEPADSGLYLLGLRWWHDCCVKKQETVDCSMLSMATDLLDHLS